jgi:hypothetical protein
MCGPSQAETNINQEQQDFYKQLTSQYSTIFGENQGILQNLTSAFTPILQAGPGQTGFTPAEETNLRTQATESAAQSYAQAQRATAGILATQGGGNLALPSGVTSQILANQATRAAQTQATAQQKITADNYATGRQNWLQAASVLGTTAGQLNPNAYSSSATGAGSSAASLASQMNQESLSPWNAAISSVGGILGNAAGRVGYTSAGGLTYGSTH